MDAWPRSLAALSLVPSGITAPGLATATVWPAATLGAPQTIWEGSPSPVSTMADAAAGRRRGAGSASSTLPTTKLLERADAVVLDPLDLGAGHGQALGERERVEVGARSTRAASSSGTRISGL